MSLSGFLAQLLNGLAGASSLFLVSVGLSLIFGVTRIVNFAHGSVFMLGLYVAYSLATQLGGGLGFWLALPGAALAMAVLGTLVEVTLLRRIYQAPELLQLLATFALVLVLQDATLWLWGAEDLLGPRAPGLAGAVEIDGRRFPSYDLFLVGVAPTVLLGLWWLLQRTRWGILVRAATQDREMAAALGVDQARLFTSVFALGCALAGLGGALQLPREPASLGLDLVTVTDAFVVVVIGGLGSVPGAFVAALLLGLVKALCIGLGTVQWGEWSFSFSKATLVVEFVVMAVVLLFRPWGLMGRELPLAPVTPEYEGQHHNRGPRGVWWWRGGLALLLLAPWLSSDHAYWWVLGVDVAVAALFAASLHLIMGAGGLHSFGHAAYFGVGAYGAAALLLGLGWPMEASLLVAPLLAVVVAMLLGWVSLRLSGIYFAMLTLACAQMLWAVAYQWDGVTGGSNGLSGVWPAPWLSDKRMFYSLVLVFSAGAVFWLWRIARAPLGYALRAVRDSRQRALAVGIDARRVQWLAFVIAGGTAGLAGALAAFSKGGIAPEVLGMGRSVDALVSVMLGGLHTLSGPVVGAGLLTWLQDSLMRGTPYWRAVLGGVILLIVLVFPGGVVGSLATWRARWRGRVRQEPTA